MASRITSFEANLEAAQRQYADGFDTLRDQPGGTHELITQDLGALTGTSVNIGHVDPSAPVRVQRHGEAKIFDTPRAYGATYDKETLYKAHELSRDDLEFDHSGRVGRMIAAFLASDAKMFDERAWAKIVANTDTGPDGVALFSTAHPHGYAGATQANLVTDALSHTSFRTGMRAMPQFRREDGSYYNTRATHLFVGPELETTAKEIVGADKPLAVDASGAEATSSVVAITSIANVYQGEVTLVIVPEMDADPDMWMLVDASKPAKPFVRSIGANVAPVFGDKSNSDKARDRNMFDFIREGDWVFGPGAWQCAYAGKPA